MQLWMRMNGQGTALRRTWLWMLLLWLNALILVPAAQAQLQFVTNLDPASALLNQIFVEPGDTLYIRITDAAAATNGVTETRTATAASGGDTEVFFLTENGDTGVFSGFFNTRYGLPTPIAPNGILDLRGRETLTVTDNVNGANTANLAVDLQATLRFLEVSGPFDPANPVIPGQPLPQAGGELKILTANEAFFLRLEDDDLNLNAALAETADVTVTTNSGDTQVVTLTETGVNTGIFMALQTTAFALVGTLANGIVELQAGNNAVTATFLDVNATTAGNVAVTLTPQIDVRGGTTPAQLNLLTSPTADGILNPGEELRAQVIGDTDSFTNPNAGPGNDTIQVTLTSFRAGGIVIDRETIVLPEDSLVEGRFELVIPYTFVLDPVGSPPAVDSGLVSVTPAGQVQLAYQDPLAVNGERNRFTQLAVPLNVAFAVNALQPTFVSDLNCNGAVARVEPGDTIFMCVQDPDANLTPDVDRVTVTVTSNRPLPAASQDVETVVLQETGNSTGIFTGSLDTKFGDLTLANNSGALLDGNGILEVRGRDFDTTLVSSPQITLLYVPVSGAVLIANNPTLAVNLDGQVIFAENGEGRPFINGEARPATAKIAQFRAGEGLFVEVVDDDANRDPALRETLQVTLTSFTNAAAPAASPLTLPLAGGIDQEVVSLLETDVNTGIFTISDVLAGVNRPFNQFPTNFLAAGNGTITDGTLAVRAEGNLIFPAGTGPSRTNALNTVVVEYQDQEITSGAGTTFRRDQVFVRQGTDATITLNTPALGGPLNPNPGALPDFRVTISGTSNNGAIVTGEIDPDTNIHAGPGNDTVTVTVTSRATPGGVVIDRESFQVSEDNLTEGVFQRSLPYRFITAGAGTVNDGLISAQSGGTVEVSINDNLSEDGLQNRQVLSTVNVAFLAVTPLITFARDLQGGGPVPRIEPGDTIYLRVDDLNADLTPDVDRVTVTLTTQADLGGGDSELVTLEETGPRTGVFTGLIDSKFGDVIVTAPGNGMLEVRGRDFTDALIPVSAPQITANYTSVSTTPATAVTQAVNLDATLQFVKDGSASTQVAKVVQIRAGEPLFFRVIDDDANRNPLAVETIQVTVTSFAGGVPGPSPVALAGNAVDQERFNLTETGANTGIFTLAGNVSSYNSLPTLYLAAGTGTVPNVLELRTSGNVAGTNDINNTILLEYNDAEITANGGSQFLTDSIFIRSGPSPTGFGVQDLTPLVANTITGGNRMSVTITGDLDSALLTGTGHGGIEHDFEPGLGNETRTVTVTSRNGGGVAIDTEVLILAESASVQGTYTGLIDTRYVIPGGAGASNNGILELVQGGSVDAQGTDFLAPDGNPAALINSATLPGNALVGTIAVNGPIAGTVEFVNSEDPVSTALATSIVTRIQPGDTLYIRLQDQDLQTVVNGLTNDVTVRVTNTIGDSELVHLRGTSVPNVFTGTLPTIFGDTLPGGASPDARVGDGVLQVRGRDQITVTYNDAIPVGIITNTQAMDVEILGAARWMTNGGRTEQQGNNIFRFDGRLQALKVFESVPIDSLSVRAGNPAFIVVTDDDLNADPNGIDTVTVIATGTAPLDTETLTLVETGNDTGVFVLNPATFPNGIRTQLVAAGSGAAVNNILEVNQASTVGLTYQDTSLPSPPTGAVGANATLTDSITIQVGANATILAIDQLQPDLVGRTIRAGNNMQITVVEPDLTEPRFNPNVIDSVTVTITSGGLAPNTDAETLVLHETGLDTGIFTGFIPTSHRLAGTPVNGILEIADTDPVRRQILISYVDPQPATPGSQTDGGAIAVDTSNVLIINQTMLTRLGADATVGFLSTQCSSSTEFIMGDTIRVSVSDPNFTGLGPNLTLNVSVTAPSGDIENIVLTQIGNTADFNNAGALLPTSYDQSVVRGDGILELVGGSTDGTRGEPVTATYLIPLDAQGRVNRPVTAVIRAFTRATIRFAVDRRNPNPNPGGPPTPANPPNPRFGNEGDLFSNDDSSGIFRQGDRLFIRVVDPDRDFPANSTVQATLDVTITSVNLLNPATPGDAEVVTLTEQPRLNGETVRGVFIGFIDTAPVTPAGALIPRGDGVIQLIGNDLITGTYTDVNTNSGDTCLVSSINSSAETRNDGTIQIVDSATGITSIPVLTLTILPGEATPLLFIRVFDRDLDSDNTGGTDAGPVITITTDVGDRETVNTLESTTTPGEFRARVPLVFGRPIINSGQVEVMGGDTVTACYTDALNIVPGISTQRCASATILRLIGGVLEILNPRTGLYQEPNRLEQFIIGEALRIRVRDNDPNTTANPDTIQITIATSNATKPDSEVLILTETGNNTGVFEGQIATGFPDIINSPVSATARNNNGILTLTGGDTITVTYIDAADGTGQINIPVVGVLTTAQDYRQALPVSNVTGDNSTLQLPNLAKVTVPPGALQLRQALSFELKYRSNFIDEYNKNIPLPLNPGLQLAGDSGRVSFYEVRPSGLVFKKLITFEIPVPATVTGSGSTTMLGDADRQRLRVMYFDGFDWQSIGGTFFRDAVGREFIRATSNHLTVFTLGLDDRPPPTLAGPLLSDVTLDKNPFTPNGDGINDLVNIQFGLGATANVTVKVLDVNGDLVRTLLDTATFAPGFNSVQWDGTYAFSERRVPPGLYVVTVQATSASAKDIQSVGVAVVK